MPDDIPDSFLAPSYSLLYLLALQKDQTSSGSSEFPPSYSHPTPALFYIVHQLVDRSDEPRGNQFILLLGEALFFLGSPTGSGLFASESAGNEHSTTRDGPSSASKAGDMGGTGNAVQGPSHAGAAGRFASAGEYRGGDGSEE